MVVICDENMRWPGDAIVLPAGEKSKSLSTVNMIYDELYRRGCLRDITLVGFGGGVVLDIAGFVAATWCRGVKFISIPTTLLAMVDACEGGKNGVNFREMKNAIGTFYNPDEIRIEPRYLKTLPERDYRCGMAEVIKCGIIRDKPLLDIVENGFGLWKKRDEHFLREIIKRCLQVKRDIVAQDKEDHGLRHILNYGHTVAHAIEALSGYTIPHGEAVAIGLSVESQDVRVNRILELYGFDLTLPFSMDEIKQASKRDKKCASV